MCHRSVLGAGRMSCGMAILLAVAFVLSQFSVPAARASDEGWSEAAELAQIRAEIAATGADWEAGPTDLTKVPPAERANYLGYVPIPDSVFRAGAEGVLEALPHRDIPSAWDWRTLGGTTPAKNQGGCGSCWAFGSTGALESLYKITTGTQVLFSEQQVISCNDGGAGCA